MSMVAHGLLVIFLVGWAECLPPPRVRGEEDMMGVSEGGGAGFVCGGSGGVCIVSGEGSDVYCNVGGVGGVCGVVVDEGRSFG